MPETHSRCGVETCNKRRLRNGVYCASHERLWGQWQLWRAITRDLSIAAMYRNWTSGDYPTLAEARKAVDVELGDAAQTFELAIAERGL